MLDRKMAIEKELRMLYEQEEEIQDQIQALLMERQSLKYQNEIKVHMARIKSRARGSN